MSCILFNFPLITFCLQLFPVHSENKMYQILKIVLSLVAFAAAKSPRRRWSLPLVLMGKLTRSQKQWHNSADVVSIHRRIMLAIFVPAFLLTLVSVSHLFLLEQGHHEEGSIPSGNSLQYVMVSPTLCLLMVSTIIHEIYYRHRSHKHGNLMICHQIASICATFLPLLFTILMLIYPIPLSCDQVTERAVGLLPFLTGALVASTAAAYFASVADAWYAVGTGQFQMIAVDAVGIAFYFVLPLVVLLFCFMDKYGSRVQSILVWAASVFIRNVNCCLSLERIFGLDNCNDNGCQMLAHVFLVVHMVNAITWGIKLVNSQCPIAGYLYGRTYTHGRPNTKKIAICVDYSTLFDKNTDAKEKEAFLRELVLSTEGSESARAVFNINVTATDLLYCRQHVEKLYAQGHELVLTVDDDASHETIRLAYDAYRNIFNGKSPSWYHPSMHQFSSIPEYHSVANSLGLRSAMWSHCIVSPEEVAYLNDRLRDHNGGLLVYVCGSENVLPILNRLMTLLRKGEFIPATLSSVIPMDNRMDL